VTALRFRSTSLQKPTSQVEQRFGGVDVVVHTAGVMELAPLVDLDLAVLDKIWRINGHGTFVVDQQAARRVRAGGAIISFSTSVTRPALTNYSAYAASKGAVEAMTLFLDGKDQATIDRLA
jgi:3-oxoacyl-[acyl-carrier protein] reductase